MDLCGLIQIKKERERKKTNITTTIIMTSSSTSTSTKPTNTLISVITMQIISPVGSIMKWCRSVSDK